MKSVFYLSTVVRAYRNVLDAIMEQRLTTELLTYWEGELEKVSHRPYTSGFLYGRPEDHAINPEFSEPIKPYAFCGVVLDYDPMTQLAKIEQRNKSFFTLTQRSEYFSFPWVACTPKPVKLHLLVMAAYVEVSYAQRFEIIIDGVDGRLND